MNNLDEMLASYSMKNRTDAPSYGTVKPSGLVENMLRESQQDKVEAIRENIADIENMIKHREDLSQETIASIEEVVDGVEKVLLEIQGYSWGNSNVEQTDLKKEMLKKKFDMIQCKVTEKVSQWQDVAALRKDVPRHAVGWERVYASASLDRVGWSVAHGFREGFDSLPSPKG